MVARHGPALLRVANQFSLCQDDALDAYQRGLEIYLRRLETVDPATEGAWMRVVARRTFVTTRPGQTVAACRASAVAGRSVLNEIARSLRSPAIPRGHVRGDHECLADLGVDAGGATQIGPCRAGDLCHGA